MTFIEIAIQFANKHMQVDAAHGESTATQATRFPVGEIRPTLDFARLSRASSEFSPGLAPA